MPDEPKPSGPAPMVPQAPTKSTAPAAPAHMTGPGKTPVAQPLPVAPQVDPQQLATAMIAVQTAMQARATSQLPTPNMDETVPGGRYMVDGKVVNAHGHEVKDEDQSGAKPEDKHPLEEK